MKKEETKVEGNPVHEITSAIHGFEMAAAALYRQRQRLWVLLYDVLQAHGTGMGDGWTEYGISDKVHPARNSDGSYVMTLCGNSRMGCGWIDEEGQIHALSELEDCILTTLCEKVISIITTIEGQKKG